MMLGVGRGDGGGSVCELIKTYFGVVIPAQVPGGALAGLDDLDSLTILFRAWRAACVCAEGW